MEQEMEKITKATQEYASKGKKVPDELVERKQELDIKMSMLVISVQTGKLTMEGSFFYFPSLPSK